MFLGAEQRSKVPDHDWISSVLPERDQRHLELVPEQKLHRPPGVAVELQTIQRGLRGANRLFAVGPVRRWIRVVEQQRQHEELRCVQLAQHRPEALARQRRFDEKPFETVDRAKGMGVRVAAAGSIIATPRQPSLGKQRAEETHPVHLSQSGRQSGTRA